MQMIGQRSEPYSGGNYYWPVLDQLLAELFCQLANSAALHLQCRVTREQSFGSIRRLSNGPKDLCKLFTQNYCNFRVLCFTAWCCRKLP